MRSYLCAFLYFVLPIFSASQDQIFGKFLDFQKILEKKLYEIDFFQTHSALLLFLMEHISLFSIETLSASHLLM